ncbi:MAG: hypothetical protein Phog2KO_32320 [Phototrophicaceae bacterium]
MTSISTHLSRLYWLWLIPIILVVFGLGLSQMQTDGIWLDEFYTHLSSGTGGFERFWIIESILRTALYDRAWPPLYYILQNIWGGLAGNSLLADRLFPTYFGLLSVALSYRLAKELIGHTGAVFTAILIGTSAFFVYYLHETRAYTMYVFFCVLIGWFYWQIITRPNYEVRWLRWGFPLSIAGALYTHYVVGAFVAGLLVYHLLFERPPKTYNQGMSQERWANIIRLWFNGCLLFGLWVGVLFAHAFLESESSRGLSLASLLDSSLYSFTNNTWMIAIPILLLSLLLIRRPSIRFVWVWLISTIVFISIMNMLASFLFHPRHFLALIPLFAILISASLAELYKRFKFVAIALVAIWAVLGIFYSQQNDFLRRIPKQYQGLPMTVINQSQTIADTCISAEDTLILGLSTPETENQYSAPFRLYYFRDVAYRVTYIGALLTDNESVTELPEDLHTASYSERVASMTSESDTVWLLTSTVVDLSDNIMTLDSLLLNAGYNACGQFFDENDMLGTVYSRNSCEVVLESCVLGE